MGCAAHYLFAIANVESPRADVLARAALRQL
jgi:hypothetical protein